MSVDRYELTDAPNPHVRRAREILRAHPEVKQYFGIHPQTALWISLVVGLQLAVAYLLREAAWPLVIASAWLAGSLASHSLFVLIHDAAHDLIVPGRVGNKAFGMLCNVGQGMPTAMSFRTFHLLHHSHLDEYDYDGDLAFEAEARWVGTRPLRKALWFAAFPFIQMVRPARIKKRFLDGWLVANFVVIGITDYLIWLVCGTPGLAYVILSTVFGVGFHPVGARWVQEHYTFKPGQETYSYYGPMNRFAFNIGYHNEHHDLVRVPWAHLPKVKALAPEFYDHLYAHRSWGRLFLRFIFDRDMSLFSRITRDRHSEAANGARDIRDAA